MVADGFSTLALCISKSPRTRGTMSNRFGSPVWVLTSKSSRGRVRFLNGYFVQFLEGIRGALDR